jgi:hypothetical protein
MWSVAFINVICKVIISKVIISIVVVSSTQQQSMLTVVYGEYWRIVLMLSVVKTSVVAPYRDLCNKTFLSRNMSLHIMALKCKLRGL